MRERRYVNNRSASLIGAGVGGIRTDGMGMAIERRNSARTYRVCCDLASGEEYCGEACRDAGSEDVENCLSMGPSGVSTHGSVIRGSKCRRFRQQIIADPGKP